MSESIARHVRSRPRFAAWKYAQRGFAAAAVLALAHASGGRAWALDDEARPLPVSKTSSLGDSGAVYFVEGRQRIPKGVELTVLRGIRIVGRGERPTIAVEGSLKIHGVQEKEVVLENVTVELQPVFEEIQMSQVFFRGGGGIRTVPERPCSGSVLVELIDFVERATLDLTMARGSFEASFLCSDLPVKLHAADDPATRSNTVKVEIRGCKHVAGAWAVCPHKARVGFRGGLEIAGANEVIVRESRLGGDLVSIRDWRKKLLFDGNKVDAKQLEFVQPVAGRFRVAQFLKCDVYGTKLKFQAPPRSPKETEDVTLDRWFFSATGSDKDEVAKSLEDGRGDPQGNGTRAKLLKLAERPVELGGPPPK